jgi:acetylornithine deacetylase/succinyl-diaminopimelate desuccinylase-like protein
MTSDNKKRLALWGGAVALAVALFLAPRFVRRNEPELGIEKVDMAAARMHDATRLVVDLLRIDTTNPPGVTRPAIERLAEAFACEGIPYVLVGDDPRWPVLVARLAGRKRDGALLLLNHLDVVEAGDASKWNSPPFAGELGKGQATQYLYGRGILDMKGLAAANFYAMARLKRDGIVPGNDIVYVGESGEETFDPSIGIGWLVKNRPDLLAGVTDAFNEGGVNEVITSQIRRFGIEVLQKATVSVNIDGKSKGDVEDFRSFLVDTDKRQPYHLGPTTREFLQFIGPSRNDVWGRSMVEPDRLLSAAWFRLWAPDVYKALVRDAIYPGEVEKHGDGWRMEMAITLLPGSSSADYLKKLDGWLEERSLTRSIRFITPESVATPETGPAWDALQTALRLDPTRADVGIYVLPASYTNSAYLRAHGYRAYGISPFNVNINDAGKIHHINERMLLPNFVEGVERMVRILREFATAGA